MTLGRSATRRCKLCRERFTPDRPTQIVHADCVEPWVESLKKKREAKAKAEAGKAKRLERAADRTKREQFKRLGTLLAEAQKAFNEFIRLRDRDRGCFVCDKPLRTGGNVGGDYDAGHVRSRGAAGHLRFNEDNCHGECKDCNASFGAKPHQIEAGAIRRIGQERFDVLKNDNAPRKWDKDEVRAIRDLYRAKAKELKEKTK